jgi:hypothetical protein
MAGFANFRATVLCEQNLRCLNLFCLVFQLSLEFEYSNFRAPPWFRELSHELFPLFNPLIADCPL